jgi:hypothetical protein
MNGTRINADYANQEFLTFVSQDGMSQGWEGGLARSFYPKASGGKPPFLN